MAQQNVGINTERGDRDWSTDAGERARLLQSPNVETGPKSAERQGPGAGTTSALGAIFIVVNAALGAGLLNFPAAFSTAGGVAAGIALQMSLLVFIIGGLVILAYCSRASNERTYQEVVWAVCGKVPGVLCEVAIAVYTFGTCIAFLIIIGDQQDKIIAALMKDPPGTDGSCWYTDRKFTISVTAFLLILPLSIPKEIGFQKYASSLSVIGTWYVTTVVIIKYIWPDKEITPGYIPTRPSSWMAVFNAMPTICFGFQGLRQGKRWDKALNRRTQMKRECLKTSVEAEDRDDLLCSTRSPLGGQSWLVPRKTWSNVVASIFLTGSVPCEQRAGLQQHEAPRGEAVGSGGDGGHAHCAHCLHGDRRLWVPDVWGDRGPGCAVVLPLQRHPCRHRAGLHHPLRADVLSHSALLRQGCAGGSLAALQGGAGGGRCGARETPACVADGQLVSPDSPPGLVHPRYRQSHLAHWGPGGLLHLRLPRTLPDSSQTF
ncbi:sodium-coupled neutral amino acid transporter 7 isoform X1 [Carettochelys insculpta]|uniref:sodium-coupled neutral amino acid transporter 7 isoform X1 n=1 Tax=Carettochelys insculpta TaxID=44489 RepID=UPI003EBAB7E9